jgi:O-acetyl-ADP-ribose deacetylase (regulator of RNase III)
MISEKVKNQIQVVQGDITKLECDCIVNAANRSLLGGGGVDGAIHRAAGPELLAECRTLHGCRTGEAKITKGYRLKAKYIIHTVGPIYSGTAEDAAQLADCYCNSLDLAKEHNVHSVAFPAISTGVYGYPLDAATQIAVDTVTDWLQSHVDYDMSVIFCCFDARTAQVYQTKME